MDLVNPLAGELHQRREIALGAERRRLEAAHFADCGSSAANRDISDATSHADSNTTCPDGQRTSTASVDSGSTVTGTNTIAGCVAKGHLRAGDFAGGIVVDEVEAAAASSRARNSRFQ